MSAAAQDPYGCIDSLSDAEVRSRNRWLDHELQEGKTHARLWWYGQITLWSGVVGFQVLSIARADTVTKRFPAYVGLVGAGLTLLQLLVVPHTPAYLPQRFRRHPASTPEERRDKLRYGLEGLERGATRQRLVRGVLAHGQVLLWNGFWTAYNGARFRDWGNLAFQSIGGLVLSEFRILSAPQDARHSWEAARGMICGARYHNNDDVDYADWDAELEAEADSEVDAETETETEAGTGTGTEAEAEAEAEAGTAAESESESESGAEAEGGPQVFWSPMNLIVVF